MSISQLCSIRSIKHSFIYLVIALFPVLIATIQHGGVVLYSLILLFGLIFGWASWGYLEAWEKRLLLGFCVFFVLICLSLVNTQDIELGVKKLERYILFPLVLPMYFFLRKYKIEAGKPLLAGILFASLVMFLQSVYQVYGLDMVRAVGGYNAIIFGDIAMLLSVILVCALLTMSKCLQHILIGGVAIVFALIASLLSGSKGAWVLIPVIMVWLLWVYRLLISKRILTLLAILGCVMIVILLNLEPVKRRIDIAITQYDSYSQDNTQINPMSERLEMWKDSISIWQENPILGTGIGDFKSARSNLYSEGLSNLKMPYGHAHSIYFDMLASAGLLGITSLLIFVLIIPYKVFRQNFLNESDGWIRFYALSGMATVIAFSVFGLTEGWLARNAFTRTYVFFILVFMSSIAIRKIKKTTVVLS